MFSPNERHSGSHQLASHSTRLVAFATALFFLSSSIQASATELPSGTQDTASAAHRIHDRGLIINAPRFGGAYSRRRVTVKIHVGRHENSATLKVKLNGYDISDRLHSTFCSHEGCEFEGELSLQHGLKTGQNLISARVNGWKDEGGDSQRVIFDYQTGKGLEDGQNTIQYYEPASIGMSTVGNGGNGTAWINLTTGNKAGVTDTALQNIPGGSTISVAYPDASIAINCQGWLFQTVILDRQNPSAAPETSVCANSEAEMESSAAASLARPLNNSDLIIFGTTPGNFAGNTILDTSPIGGTNYGKISPKLTLWYYDIIGVKGATPGTAHENYTTSPGTDTPFQYASFLAGTLMQDGDGNYNYIPSDERNFQVVSGANPSLQIGWQSYRIPANSAPGAFWVVVVDRFSLEPIPINYSPGNWTVCAMDTASQACGGVFNPRTDGGAALASMLAGVNPQNFVAITTTGCPFDSAGEVSVSLANAIQNLGGAGYSLQKLNTTANTCAYSLVSSNSASPSKPLNGPVALSANQLSAQGQTGSIHGYLARNNQGLYQVASSDQMVPGTDNSPSVPGIDYTFEQTASSQRQDWPLTDTPGHLAAYHDISQQLLTPRPIGETGSYIYDVRSFYTDLATANELTELPASVLQQTTPSNWDTATPQEFTDARDEIGNELQQLGSAMGYLTGPGGNGGVRGLLNGTNDTIFKDAFNIANAIGHDQNQAAQQLVNGNGANILNLLAGVTSLFGAIAAPFLPEVGVFLGVTSGALWSGSAGVSPLSGTLPGPESAYDIQLADIMNDAGTYSSNLLSGYDSAVDNIFSDGTKLATVGGLTSNSDSNWSIKNLAQGDGLSTAFAAGVARSLWLDVIPGIYGIRENLAYSSGDPSTWGSTYYLDGNAVCQSVYSINGSGVVPAVSMISFPSISASGNFDAFVMAEGAIKNEPKYPQDSSDVAISSSLATLLTTNQSVDVGGETQQGINLPPLLLYTDSNLQFGPPLYYTPNQKCFPQPY
jgi:hypothetical protein